MDGPNQSDVSDGWPIPERDSMTTNKQWKIELFSIHKIVTRIYAKYLQLGYTCLNHMHRKPPNLYQKST